MGAMIKADKNQRGRTRKVSRQGELVRSILVHAASAFICALVCCYSYWFPWFYCFINHFVWIYLPSVWPVVFGPKCMFVVANAIVAVVIDDWRQTCAKSKSPHQDMYEEYVRRRSRGARRVLVYEKIERREGTTVKKMYAKPIEIKKEKMPKEIIYEKTEEIAEVIHENKEDVVETSLTNYEVIHENKEDVVESNCEENNEEMIEEAFTSTPKEKQDEMKEQIFVDANISAEKTSPLSQDHADEVAPDLCKEESRLADDVKITEIMKEEETRSGDDDLNKRVEDFIARVNKRRWAEANSWLICSA